jgi:hypothetical protein
MSEFNQYSGARATAQSASHTYQLVQRSSRSRRLEGDRSGSAHRQVLKALNVNHRTVGMALLRQHDRGWDTMLFRLIVASALILPAFAFDDDRYDRRERRDGNGRWSRHDRDSRSAGGWERNRRRSDGYDGYEYGNNSGYGRQNTAILSRTIQDLQTASARNRIDGHERDHANRAMRELRNLGYRGGTIDSRSLSRVLEDLDHLSRADQIHPRDRQVLARDRQALASMYGGYGYNVW